MGMPRAGQRCSSCWCGCCWMWHALICRRSCAAPLAMPSCQVGLVSWHGLPPSLSHPKLAAAASRCAGAERHGQPACGRRLHRQVPAGGHGSIHFAPNLGQSQEHLCGRRCALEGVQVRWSGGMLGRGAGMCRRRLVVQAQVGELADAHPSPGWQRPHRAMMRAAQPPACASARLQSCSAPRSPCSYFDAETIGLDFAGMIADLEAAPEGSVILLHGV